DLATFAGNNVLTVRVDATLGEGWYYEGAGIYRHVWLTKTAPLHLVPDGIYVRSELHPARVALTLGAEIQNDSQKETIGTVRWEVVDPRGSAFASALSKPQL